MYLARKQIDSRQTRFFIRHSFTGAKHMTSRDLFDLGTDPTRFIHYPGGNSYYIDPCIEEALQKQGLAVDQNDLDALFFEFLAPETRRVIAGFDRRSKRIRKTLETGEQRALHIFDKRRYHFLRFGSRTHQYINRVEEKIFWPLMNKSRDEIEQYFIAAEQILRPNESLNYIATIFELKRFVSDRDSELPAVAQLDAFFVEQLCGLNSDGYFLAGVPVFQGLYEYLIKYAILYFDSTAPNRSFSSAYIQDFINRHRTYKPPPAIRIKIQEAEKLFGHTWKALENMDRATLTRIYRQMALQHHPDQGGHSETFQRLTTYYQALLAKKK